MNVLQWLVSNAGTILAALVALVSVVSMVVGLVPGDTSKVKGVLGTILSVLDRISVLTGRSAAGTLKLPGTKSQFTK